MDDQLLKSQPNNDQTGDEPELRVENLSPELQQKFKDLGVRVAEQQKNSASSRLKVLADLKNSFAQADELIKKLDSTADDLDKSDAEAEKQLDKLLVDRAQEEAEEEAEDAKPEEEETE